MWSACDTWLGEATAFRQRLLHQLLSVGYMLCLMFSPGVQIHDELLLEVEKEALPEAAALVRDCMEGAVKLTVPMPVKLHVGPSWGQLQPYQMLGTVKCI